MSEDSRKHILALCNKSGTHFQVIMSRLRKTTFLPAGKVNAKYIPKISESEDKFNLLVFFIYLLTFWVTYFSCNILRLLFFHNRNVR